MASSLLLSLPTLALALLSSLQPFPVRGDAFDDLWSQYVQQTETPAQQYESTGPRRENNLDHWDVPTAAAYLGLHPQTLRPLPRHASESSSADLATDHDGALDEYVGHDAAVLFYAQWCRNCHAVAPSWDAIATHLGAGDRSSDLVMALFDCEKSAEAGQLCLAAGVKAYPTIMFVGSGEYHDTDVLTKTVLGRDRSAGPYGATELRRTVKFQGNWQYGDQVLDWVKIMRGLSKWHRVQESGPFRGLRDALFGIVTGGKYKGNRSRTRKDGSSSLPVGVPPNFQAELRGVGAGTGARAQAGAREIEELESKLNATAEEKGLYKKAVEHSSVLIDGLLFSKGKDDVGGNDAAGTSRDPFSVLTSSDGWFKNATDLPVGAPADEHPTILRSCAIELTIDYCTRVTTRATSGYLEELGAIPESDPFPTLEEIEARLFEDVAKEEPYCGLVEACMLSDFEGGECRPAECPFENENACGYVGSCLDPKVQDEYGLALGLISEGEKVMDKDWSAVSKAQQEGASATGGTNANAGVGGWGVPLN